MAEIQKDTMTAEDVKKTDASTGTVTPVLHQTTNPERAPNIPVTDAMGTSSGRDGTVVPGTAVKGSVPLGSKGADTSSADSERAGVRKAREEENAAQRAKWQEENVFEPMKAVVERSKSSDLKIKG